jgi:hypothetical protein
VADTSAAVVDVVRFQVDLYKTVAAVVDLVTSMLRALHS